MAPSGNRPDKRLDRLYGNLNARDPEAVHNAVIVACNKINDILDVIVDMQREFANLERRVAALERQQKPLPVRSSLVSHSRD